MSAVTLVDAGQLQHPGSPLSFGGTCEKTARGLVYEIADFPNMHYATHFIAAVGLSGALSFTRVVEDRLRDADKPWQRRLYYYPRGGADNCASRKTPPSAGRFCSRSSPCSGCGLPHATVSARAYASNSKLRATGAIADVTWRHFSKRRKLWPMDTRGTEQRTAPPYLVSLPEWWEPQELRESWTVLQWRYRTDQDALRLALRIVREGADAALGDVPTLRMDHHHARPQGNRSAERASCAHIEVHIDGHAAATVEHRRVRPARRGEILRGEIHRCRYDAAAGGRQPTSSTSGPLISRTSTVPPT